MKKTGRKSEPDPLRQKAGELLKKKVPKPVSKNTEAVAELKESEERYRLLFENSGEAILLTNPDGSIYSANPAACRMYGRTEDEICKIGRNGIIDLNDPRLESAINERNKNGKFKGELNQVRKDGTIFPAEVTSIVFRDTSGNKRTSMIIRDISERRKAEKEMYMQSGIMNNLAEGFNLVRLDNEAIVFTNPKFDEMFGYEHGELIGRNISVVNASGARSPDETKQDIVDTVNRSGEWHGEILNIKKNGEHFWCYVNISMFDHADYGKVYLSVHSDINKRKQAEEALHLEKENFRRSLDDSPLGIRIVSADGDTIYANQAILNIYGYDSLEELQKTPLKKRYTPESYAESQIRKQQRNHGDLSTTNYEISIVRKNGDIRHLQVFRKEVLWDGVMQFQVIYNDITERKHVEEALHESEERYRRLVEGSPNAIAVHSKGRFVYVNPAGAKLIGVRSPKELIGKPILDVVHPDSRSQVMERLRHEAEGKEAPLSEEKFLKFDGSVIDVEVVGIPFSYQGQTATQVIVRDITERKLIETALRESKQMVTGMLEFNRKILDTSSIGILTYKKSGQCISANAAAAKVLGSNIPQLLAQNFHEISSWKKSGIYQKAIKALDTGIEQLLDVHLVTTFGKDVWLSVSFSSFDSTDEQHLLLFTSDINERKQAEEEIIKSKELLEDLHMHLNEILENERAQISREIHDQIGQSLTALKLDLNWMYKYIRTNPEPVAKLEGMIDLVSNTIKDVQRISSDLRPGILDELGLVSAIEWYCGEFENRTGIKCNLKLDDSDYSNPHINLTFFRVLQETLTNVIRHARASSVKVILQQTNQGTTLTIQDNGIGISREEIDSNKSLGLISMRERLKQFNGKIDISSKKGDGTKLTFFIPF